MKWGRTVRWYMELLLAAALMWGSLLAGCLLGGFFAYDRRLTRTERKGGDITVYETVKADLADTASRAGTAGDIREAIIETGVDLAWAPYAHMLACSGAGILLLRRKPHKKACTYRNVRKKRRSE